MLILESEVKRSAGSLYPRTADPRAFGLLSILQNIGPGKENKEVSNANKIIRLYKTHICSLYKNLSTGNLLL